MVFILNSTAIHVEQKKDLLVLGFLLIKIQNFNFVIYIELIEEFRP